MKTASQILKNFMSVKYCSGTRFDYLDKEEKVMILKAMRHYNRTKIERLKDKLREEVKDEMYEEAYQNILKQYNHK